MANDLTGDFDVVAQFTAGAANRILAAMHRSERFPHSLTLRVQDVAPRGPFHPSVLGSVDIVGEATVNPRLVPLVPELPSGTTIVGGRAALDAVINVDLAGVQLEPVVPSNLRGLAQLQVSPPTMELSDVSGDRVTVRMDLMARYSPEPGSPQVAEFLRGRLQVGAPISQLGSQTANVIDINFRSPSVTVNFTPLWSSRPLAPEDVAGITLLVRNALRTSFLPSNTVVPPLIKHLQFKAFATPAPAIAVLLKLEDPTPGTRGTVNRVFVGAANDFAYAAGVDFLRAKFHDTLNQIKSAPISNIPVLHTHYSVELTDARLELQPNRMQLVFRGQARTPSRWLPNFGFTVRQPLSLAVNGATAELVVHGMSLELSNGIADRIASPFKGGAISRIQAMRDQALADSGVRESVRDMLDANNNLGKFLNSLFTAPRQTSTTPTETVALAYTHVEIRTAGIVLHGTLGVQHWPPPHVEFEEIPAGQDSPLGPTVFDGPTYSALRTWIPGGTILHYEWHRLGQQRYIDQNRFVLLPQGPVVSDGMAMRVLPGFNAFCLTVSGTRVTASGPVALQPVGKTYCVYQSFPLPVGGLTGELEPAIALSERDEQGRVRVVGHTVARRASSRSPAPNLVIHFSAGSADRAGGANAERLELLLPVLEDLARSGTATAVVAVMSTEQLAAARYIDGVTYTDDRDGAWRARYGGVTGNREATILVLPDGNVAWRHEGDIDPASVIEAVRRLAAPAKRAGLIAARPAVRIGHPPPNLLFEHAPGHMLTLRKLSGRPATVVFWKSGSQPSIETVRDLQSRAGGEPQQVTIAINSGDSEDLARKTAAENGFTSLLVMDAQGAITKAYGVSVWPTVFDVDGLGIVRGVRYGRPVPVHGVEQHG